MLRKSLRSLVATSPLVACFVLIPIVLAGPAAAAAPDKQAEDIARAYVADNLAALGLAEADTLDLIVTDSYTSRHTGTRHVYLQQIVDGIAVINAVASVAVSRDGHVAHFGNRLLGGLNESADPARLVLDAREAVESAASALELGTPSDLRILEAENDRDDQRTRMNGGGISRDDIRARLVYQPLPSGRLRLAWDLVIDTHDETQWLNLRVDAANGEVIDVVNWVHSEQYEVYEIPIESPNHASNPPPADGRTLAVDPFTVNASPFGWHDTDASAGPEFTITRGNNVHAYADKDGNDVPDGVPNQEPDGGATLDFTGGLVPVDFTASPNNYVQAAIASLFYWNNITHDLLYEFGFDEAAGNFQENNYGNGGLGGDYVQAEAQNLGNCNANFGTPSDGFRPRMQMFQCTNTNPARDSDFDHGVIVHEYGHGVSNRLTGGPANVGCLSVTEQMGEGWSDYLGLMMTIEAGDQAADARGMGTYFIGQPVNGPGIRNAPYSTDFGVNSFTYSNVNAVAVPHGVGFIWATMLWDMTWDLIDVYGLNTDLYADYTTGGNNLALQLVMDGMKLQACSPGFVDGRDAILAADDLLTGDGTSLSGENQCLIWGAFARRGLGFSADQGSSNSVGDGTAAFDLPPFCESLAPANPHQDICQGGTPEWRLGVGSDFTSPPVTFTTSGRPPGTTVGFTANPLPGPMPAVNDFTLGNTAVAAAGDYTLTITGNDGVNERSTDLTLTVFDAAPGASTNMAPADAAVDEAIQPTFEWSAIADAVTYVLEVSDDMAFSNIVHTVSGLTGTTYDLPIELAFSTTYYWRVRGVNPCNTTDSTTTSFTTVPSPGACADGVVGTDYYMDDLEGGQGSWTTGGTASTWQLDGSRTTSGTNAWYGEDITTESDQFLISPAIALPAEAADTLTLQFENYQLFETPNGDGRCWDAGILEVSINGGGSWEQVPNSAMLTDPYDNVIWNDTPGNNPITDDYGATDAWCNPDEPWKLSVVDVSAWAGETVNFRWRLGTDGAAGGEGWYIDDIRVQLCPITDIFADGFESGDVTSWSGSQP